MLKIPVEKSTTKQRAVFTRDEIKILLNLPDENYETGLRDKVLLSLMYATGARAQEICDLKVRDIRMNDTSASITLIGKGLKIRQVGISKKLADTLHRYIIHRHIEKYPERHIFSSQTHEQMTISCVEGIYKKVDIVTIKNILGHVSVQTTQIYAEMSQDTVDKKLKEWNETWFGDNQKIDVKEATDYIPEFLRKR